MPYMPTYFLRRQVLGARLSEEWRSAASVVRQSRSEFRHGNGEQQMFARRSNRTFWHLQQAMAATVELAFESREPIARRRSRSECSYRVDIVLRFLRATRC